MTKLSEKLSALFRCVVLVLFGIFIIYLTLLSLFSTNYCFVGKRAVFVADSPVKPLFCYAGLIGMIVLGRRYGGWQWFEAHHKKLRRLGNFLLFLFLLYFVSATQLHPHGDQLAISNAAVGLRKYDFSLFVNNSYFVYWPFQSRITVFLWGFFKLFGNLNYIAFQIMNACCIVTSINLVAKTAALAGFGGNPAKETLIFFVCALFWPYLFYVTFIYGNIIGFTFIAAAVYMLTLYIGQHKLRYLAGTAVFCAVGVWLKNTYLIFMIAILVFLLVDFWRSWKYINVAGMLCLVAAVSLLGSASDALLERRLGFPLPEGSPMISWVTMAFGETEDGNPVTFDGYNRDVYLENDLDAEEARKAAAEELKRRIALITDTPEHFFRFMGKKLALEWNEPTFESLVANNRPKAQIEQPGLIRRMLQEDNKNPLVKYADLFHALVLLGALSWLFCRGRKEDLSYLFFAVVFIGGFLFQLFWETCSQYTLLYFLILIPYAVSGYLAAAESVSACISLKKRNLRLEIGVGTAVFVIAVVAFVPLGIFHDLFKLDEDTVSYTEELREAEDVKRKNAGVMENGEYRIELASADGCAIAQDEEEAPAVSLKRSEKEDDGVFELYHEYGYDFLRLKSTQKPLSLSGSPADGEAAVGWDYDYITWKIIEIQGKGYAITYEKDYALTAADGVLTIRPFTGGDDQIWRFEKR